MRDLAVGVENVWASRPPRWQRFFVPYVLVQTTLIVLALFLPHSASRLASLLVVVVGAATLALGIVVRRPARPFSWWLLAASPGVAAAALTVEAIRTPGDPDVSSGPLSAAAVVASLLFAAGLALLGRRPRGSAGKADLLDVAMVAAAAVLVVWMVKDDNALTNDNPTRSVGLPLAAVLLFSAGTKLVLTTGLKWTVLLLVVESAGALLAVVLGLAWSELSELPGGRTGRLLWSAHGGLLGAAALHPSFVYATRGLTWGGGSDLSTRRLVLYGMVAAVVPTAIVVGLVERPPGVDRTAAGIAVPALAASTVLVALVGRLASATHVSQRRAAELVRRSAALARAADEQRVLREQLAYRATHDPLTGLSNRVVLAERLEWSLNRGELAAATNLLLVDLDGFKEVNDTYGHPAGDELLANIAGRLAPALPANAVVARLGGDEFGILFEEASPAPAGAFAHNVLDAVRRPLVLDGNEIVLSASVGMLLADPPSHRSASTALRDADLALYAAKNAGRDQIMVFEPRLRAERYERVRISVGLHRALARGELTLEYQPIVSLDTGDVLAVEALVRWRPPDGDPIPPAQFIPIAESIGLIHAIGSRVLGQACRDARAWYADHGVAVSVNVSGLQLRDPRFADGVIRGLAETGLPATGLIIELTEAAVVETLPASPEVEQLRRLRERGVRIAIDDFGTGYSSLARISRLPVDIVKLDSSFADGNGSAEAPMSALTAGIVEAVSSAGLVVVAEGVETEREANAMMSMKCHYVQGFYFYRPAPAATIDEILSAARPGRQT